jgi:IPT/TIG domain
LGAMENAVRRVRASQGPPAGPPEQVPAVPPAEPVRADPEVRRATDGRADRWLVTSIAVTAALVVVAAAALAASLTAGPSPSNPGGPAFSASPTPTTSHRAPGHSIPRTSGSTTTTTSPTATSAPATPGGPPVINALVPASAAPGQGIRVAGTNFLSSDGQIVATFNGQVAPTSCPAQNSCTVTVPPVTGPETAEVTITTAGGTSNALTFTYS